MSPHIFPLTLGAYRKWTFRYLLDWTAEIKPKWKDAILPQTIYLIYDIYVIFRKGSGVVDCLFCM